MSKDKQDRQGGRGVNYESLGRVIAEALHQSSLHQGRNAPSVDTEVRITREGGCGASHHRCRRGPGRWDERISTCGSRGRGTAAAQQRLRGVPSYLCEYHGYNHTHDTSNCHHLRKVFSKNWRAIMYHINMQEGAHGITMPQPRSTGTASWKQQQQQLFGAPRADQLYSSPPPAPAGNGPSHLFMARSVCPRGKSDLIVDEERGRLSGCDNKEDSFGFSEYGVRLPGVPGVMVAHVKRVPSMDNALLSRAGMPSPEGSQEWHADSGASAFITNDLTNMYDVQYLDPNEHYIQIGDARIMRVVARGSLDLKFHQVGKDGRMEDVETCVPDVLFVPGCGFNLFSLWRVSHKHEVRINRHGTQLLGGKLRFIRGIAGDSLFATRITHATTPTVAPCHASNVTRATLPPSATGGGSHGTTATSTGALPAPQQYASIQASSASPSPGTSAAYPRSQPPPSGSALLRAPGTVEANAAAAAPASSHGSTVTSAGALPAPQQHVPFQTAPVSSSPEAAAARHPSQPPPSGSALLRAPGTVEANAAAAASASPSPGAAAARPPSQPPPSGSALLWAPGTPDIEMGLLTQSGEEILPSVLDHRSATQDKPMFCPTSDQKGGIEQGGVQAGGYDQRVWTESVVESDTPPAAGASGEGIKKGDDWLFDALGVPCSGVHRGVPLGLFTGTA